MSIKIKPASISNVDKFGVTTAYYKANAGETTTYTFDLYESIYYISTANKPITSTVNLTALKQLQFPNYASLNGFTVGQNVTLLKTKPNGTTVTKTTTITAIDYTTFIVTFASLFTTASENIYLYDANTTLQVYSTDTRKDLYINLGFSKSSSLNQFDTVASVFQGNYDNIVLPYESSLIDGTKTRFYGANTGSIIVGADVDLVQQGLKSGHFQASVNVERLADLNTYTRTWRVTILSIQIGCLIDFAFNSADSSYLKFNYDVEWYSDTAGVEDPTVVLWQPNPSNTAWFNQPYLNGAWDSTFDNLTGGYPLYYNGTQSGVLTFSSASSVIGMGGMYRPTDSNYYKLNQYTQSENCMLIEMTGALAIGTYTSVANGSGAQWSVEITALTYVLGVHTVSFTVTTNASFDTFMAGQNPVDRNMILWFKVGSINHLIDFLNMEATPPPTYDLDGYTDTPSLFKLDKSTNAYDATTGLICSIEDNVYLEQKILLPKTSLFNTAIYEIVVAEVGNLDNFFVLESTSFDLSIYPPLADGALPFSVNLNLPNNLNLSSFAFNNSALQRLGAPADTLTDFGLYLRFPFAINWKYWINQINAFIYFDLVRNQNWINYQDGTYNVYAKTTFLAQNQSYVSHYEVAKIYDYNEIHNTVDEIWDAGTMTIEYFIDATNEQKSCLIDNTIMRVKVTVYNEIATVTGNVWANLTIEPFESSPRWACSTNYAHDNNVNSPFMPLSGETRLKKTFVGVNQQTFEMLIDTNKVVTGDNKITLKYFNNTAQIEQSRNYWNVKNLTESVIPNIPTTLGDCNDFIFSVFGETVFTKQEANDVTIAYKLKLANTDTIVFNLLKDGAQIAVISQSTFPNQSNARYCKVLWSDILVSYGSGEYELQIVTTTAYSSATESWGKYNLQEYSREIVEGLVNIRAYFGSNQIIDGIDFTNSNLFDTLNIDGKFGNRNPKTEVDNNIYATNLVSKVYRENLNEYIFESNPVSNAFTRKLYDLYFLSEIDLYFTDNNLSNHESYIMKRVITKEVTAPEYPKNTIYCKIIANFGDKIMNQKSQY